MRSLGAAVRVTTSDQPQTLSSFAADGRAIYFSAAKDPSIYRATRMFRVELLTDPETGGVVVGGGAVSRISEAFGSTPRGADDGQTVLFTRGREVLERPKYRGSGGTDLFTVNLASGAFARLTEEPGTDADAWPLAKGAPGGGGAIFISSRDGQNNLWRLDREGDGWAAQPTQLTRFAPTAEEVTIGHGVRDLSVSADGRLASFCVWDTLYTLELGDSNAKPKAVAIRAAGDGAILDQQRLSLDREVSEAVISPDGKTLAVVARGEVFIRNTSEGYPTRRVTSTHGRERDLAWSPDGRWLYFASDDAGLAGTASTGIYGIYRAAVELTREDLQPAKADVPAAKPEEKKDEPVKVDAPADPPAEPKSEEPKPEAKPDEPKADKPAEKKEAKPDHGKRWSEALRFTIETAIAPGTEDARHPVISPDGKKMLYTRARGDLVLRSTEGEPAERLLVESWDEADALWAGDSRHIVYAVSDLDFNSDIWLLDTQPADDGANRVAINLTRHPDLDSSPQLSADGKVLTFVSERGGENGEFDVYQIHLDRALDAMTSYERDEYFKKAAEAAGKRKPLGAEKKDSEKKDGEKKEGDKKDADKPDAEKKDDKPAESKELKFDADDAYMRVRRITSLPGAESNLAVTPGADRIIFVGTAEGDRALMSVDHKGGDRKTLQAGGVSNVTVSLTGDKVAFVRQGVTSTTTPKGGGKVDALAIDAPVVIDVARQQRQKFLEAAKVVGVNFYHPTLKGLDWPGLTRRYLSLAEQTRTNDEFNRVVQFLFGELDGSHLGIGGGGGTGGAPSPATGYLGVFAAPSPGGFRITHVARGTPAAAKPAQLKVGDVIAAIDGVRLAPAEDAAPTIDLDAALVGRAGKETLVEIKRADGGKVQTLLMIPMSASSWDDAEYWDEVALRQEQVDKLSGGKLGYLHIRAMGESAVRDFERDLYAAANGKLGLVIDVRDNGGGSTADILLSSLTAPRHAWTVPRGADPARVPHDVYPRDRRLIYAWTRPINVLINQNSFSNAEIFAHAIKTIGRGKLIGTATFGGVISTGGTSLIDGSSVRLPFRGWYLPDGTDMENNGAKPDIDVPQLPEDEAAGRDRQLEAAVTELLGRIGEAGKPQAAGEGK